MPKPAAKQFLGFHVLKASAREIAKIAERNDRTIAAELRIALSKHIRDERAKTEEGVAA